MSQSSNPQFKLVVPITGYTIRKSADGTEKYVLTGMASNTNIDLTGERMAKSAIVAMERSLETGAVTINNEHSQDWDADFGEVTKLWSTDNAELMMEAELDPDHYRTKTLIKALNKGKKLGLSIGGSVKDAALEFVEELGRKVLTYKDIALFHVAITGTPAVADTWVAPITKSMKDWKESPMSSTTKSETEVEEVVETAEAPATEPVADAPADPRPEEAPAAEEAVEEVEPEASEEVAEDETPAEGETPEAPESDTSTPSDTAAAKSSAEVTTDPENANPPAEAEAPAQAEDAPTSAESTPEPAEDSTSEVEKSAPKPIFGDYARADVASVSVRALTEELSWSVWRSICSFETDEQTPEERKAYVAQALSEYSQIVQSVANALIDTGASLDAEKSFVIPRAEEVAKSIDAKAAEVAALTKSLADRDAELKDAADALEEKTGELETTVTELETRDSELAAAVKELETIKSRKVIAFDKFAPSVPEKPKTEAEAVAIEAQKKFASFLTT